MKTFLEGLADQNYLHWMNSLVSGIHFRIYKSKRQAEQIEAFWQRFIIKQQAIQVHQMGVEWVENIHPSFVKLLFLHRKLVWALVGIPLELGAMRSQPHFFRLATPVSRGCGSEFNKFILNKSSCVTKVCRKSFVTWTSKTNPSSWPPSICRCISV